MIQQLPTSSNLDNLSLDQKAELANRKGKECFDYRVKSAIAGYECGLALIAVREQIEKEQGKRKFTAWLENNWGFSRQYAYRFIEFAEDAMCQQLLTDNPELTFNAATKLMKGLASQEKSQRQIEDETLEEKLTKKDDEIAQLKEQIADYELELKLEKVAKEVNESVEKTRESWVGYYQSIANIGQSLLELGRETLDNGKINSKFLIENTGYTMKQILYFARTHVEFPTIKEKILAGLLDDELFDLALDLSNIDKEKFYAEVEKMMREDDLKENYQ